MPDLGYCDVRSLTDRLAAPLSAEDQTIQSMPDVSPTKWHRAHTSWFFEEFVLGLHWPGYQPFHPGYRFLFNSYYEAVGPRQPRARRGMLSRPSAAEIGAYRRSVDQHMSGMLEHDGADAPSSTIQLGLHHEQQHQELLVMDIKHVLFQNPMQPPYHPVPASATLDESSVFTAASWIEFPGGIAEIGHAGNGFSFDNETPRHPVQLQSFALASRLATNREWIDFIDDGGYERPELWLSDGWACVQAQSWNAPLYWSRHQTGWEVFTLGGTRPLLLQEPVCHVSYYEADAYSRWAGARLPTEAEWEIAAAALPHDAAGIDANLLEPTRLHPRPAGPSSEHALQQLFGDVWEWTSSAHSPYPGFRPFAGALGEYNAKFMVGQYVLRGGSCATPAGHVRPTYRNFYPPWARWAFSGLRLAVDC